MEKPKGLEKTFIISFSDWESTDIASAIFYDVVWTGYAKSFMKGSEEGFVMFRYDSSDGVVELINKDYSKNITLNVNLVVTNM